MGRRGPILGITGLVFLLFGLLSHWWTRAPGSALFAFGWYSLLHLVAGLVCLVWYFVSGSASFGQFLRQRSTRYGTNALAYSIVFLAVIVMGNFLGTRYHRRVDMSAAGVNSLTEQSRQILSHLDEDVDIDAFVEGGRDPVLEELMDAYRYQSSHIHTRFIDPQVHPELAQQAGVSQVPTLRVRRGDQSTLVNKTDEESITNGIHRLATSERKKVYFIEGHGEPAIDDKKSAGGLGLFAEALKNQSYLVDKLFLPDVESVPKDAAVVVLPAGERPYFPHELEALGRYMKGGGRVLFLLEPRRGQEAVKFLADWGVDAGNNVVVDQQLRLFQGVTLGLDFIVSNYGKHPSVAPLKERTLFSLARSVRPAAKRNEKLVVEPIAYSASTSWAESDVDRLFEHSEAEFNKDKDLGGPVPIGVAVSAYAKDIGGSGDAEFEMIVFGDTTFITNKYWRQLFNDALALSTLGWLSGQEELISIGPRAVRASRAHLTAAQARTVFSLSVLVIPELILLCGIAVWWRRSGL